MINYIVDTDIALGTLNADPDDGVAILNLLSKNIDIALVSLVSGNVKIVEAYDNLNFLLNSIVCDKKFHVFQGFSNDSSFQDKFFFGESGKIN
jgi:inosine-uridine nucleoside N-ribohydrolase